MKQRTGKETYNHACSPGCIIQCSNTWYKPDGTEHSSCVEYESNWALGADCGIASLDEVADQATTALIDSAGHCLFIAFAILDIASGFEGFVEEWNAMLGTHWKTEDVAKEGAKILRKERAFNEAAGIGKQADRVPEFMKYEPLPPHNQVFDVPDAALDSVFGEM